MSVMWSKAWVEERIAGFQQRREKMATDDLKTLRELLLKNEETIKALGQDPEKAQRVNPAQTKKLAIAVSEWMEADFVQEVEARKQRMAEKRSQTKAREVLPVEGAGVESKQLVVIGEAVEKGLTLEDVVSRLVARVNGLEVQLAEAQNEILTRVHPSGVNQMIEAAFAARQTGELRLVMAKELGETLESFADGASVTALDGRMVAVETKLTNDVASKDDLGGLGKRVTDLEARPELSQRQVAIEEALKSLLEWMRGNILPTHELIIKLEAVFKAAKISSAHWVNVVLPYVFSTEFWDLGPEGRKELEAIRALLPFITTPTTPEIILEEVRPESELLGGSEENK